MQEMPSYWHEPTDPRPRYRLCRVGFSLAAMALGLLAVAEFGRSLALLRRDGRMLHFFATPLWDWLVGTPITWGSLLGSYLLIGRFADPAWRRRVLLLAAMNTVDLLFWCLAHAEVLGLPEGAGALGKGAFPFVDGTVMNLAELVLFAGLASDLIGHLGHPEEARPRHRAALIAAGVGAFLWMIVQMNVWDFRFGWPPRFRNIRDIDTFHLYIGSMLALAATALLVTIHCGRAAILCSRMLVEIDRHEKENDPFRSRSD